MPRTISNSDDQIDSRDVIARIDELRDTLQAEYDDEPPADLLDNERETLDEWIVALASDHPSKPDAEELRALEALADEASDSPDWSHGESLIRDSYFRDYAEESARDCGMIADNATWPNNHIDWDAASEALQQDYTSVDFDGVMYWIRS